MKCKATTRLFASVLIFTLTYTPVLGATSGTTALAQVSTYTYQYDVNGNLTQITDPLGRTTTTAYDVLGRKTQQTLPAPLAGTSRGVVQYGYDGQDQLLTVMDPRKLVTTYTVDGVGNQDALDSPDTGRTANTYDLAGNLKTSTDARGKLTSYSYDAINRVIRIDYASGLPSVFDYDGGTAGATNSVGKLTAMTDESGTTRYSYDAFGRVESKIQTVVLGELIRTFSVRYAYGTSGTSTGKLVSLTYPSGNRVNYVYDAAGQLARLTLDREDAGRGGTSTESSIDLLTGIVFAPFGGVQSWHWGNSTSAAINGYARTFDLNGRITSYTLGNVQTTGFLRHIRYDAAGRILGYTHEGSPTTPTLMSLDQTFAYDDLDRLTANQRATTSQQYSYDENGNRTKVVIGSNSYSNSISASSNRLTSTTGPAPAKANAYDAAGNLVSDGAVEYVYSARGRLASTKKSGLTTTYLYNALGQRISKAGNIISKGVNYFVYDEQGHLLGEYDFDGGALQETVYLGNIPVAVLANGISYVYADHLDTPRIVMRSSDNTIIWRWDAADPYGVEPPDQNPSNVGTFTFNLRFPGQFFDVETNNHYNYFRDYDPQMGSYVQSDPIGLDGGISTYAYVAGNPISNVDPKGLQHILPLPAPPVSPGGGGMTPAPGADPALPGIRHFWPKVVRDAAAAVVQACTPNEDRACSPPAGTQCYTGPDTTHSHAGLNPHYHVFQMFKFGGKCQWKYLGGKVGKGVLAVPPNGMSPCSSYAGFQGRG